MDKEINRFDVITSDGKEWTVLEKFGDDLFLCIIKDQYSPAQTYLVRRENGQRT